MSLEMSLEDFVSECQKVDSRIKLQKGYGNTAVVIDNDYVVLNGYNFPYQAHLITNFMNEQGSFR